MHTWGLPLMAYNKKQWYVVELFKQNSSGSNMGEKLQIRYSIGIDDILEHQIAYRFFLSIQM